MMKEDARELPPSAQEEKRKLAIKLWKKGNLIKEVAETVGVTANAVSGWIKSYKKVWLAKNEDEIEVHYLPPYSPELNPYKYLNYDLKAGVHSGKPASNTPQLRKKVISHMRMFQKKPARVTKCFKHEKIKYAA